MGTTAIVFLVLTVVVTGFTAGVLVSEFVSGSKQPKSETTASTTALSVVSSAEPMQDEDEPVVTAPTHKEKYDALPDDKRSLYDEVAAYAAAVCSIPNPLMSMTLSLQAFTNTIRSGCADARISQAVRLNQIPMRILALSTRTPRLFAMPKRISLAEPSPAT